jgi:hypothetical protein
MTSTLVLTPGSHQVNTGEAEAIIRAEQSKVSPSA